MKKLRVIVEEDGSVTADAVGFKGKGCEKVLAELAKELGTVKSRKNKPEYFQQADTVAQQRQGT